jgi:hypothetical protein
MYPQAASPPNIAGFGGSGAYVPPPGQNQQSFAQPYSSHQQQQQQSGFGALPLSPATHGMPQYPQSHNVSNGPNGQPRNDNRQLAAAGMEEVKVKVDTPNNGTPEVAPPPTTEKKKEEKHKRETRMVYSDNEISPVRYSAISQL